MIDDERPEERLDDLGDVPGLAGVLGALGETVARTPPPDVRGEVLRASASRPRVGVDPLPASEVYAQRVHAMSALLDELADADWDRDAPPYEWSVHALVAHLALIEEHTARQMGLTNEAPLPAGHPDHGDHLLFGRAEMDALVDGAPEVTIARWRRAASRITAHVLGPSFDHAAAVPLHSWPFDATTALIVRSFELWTHADDIRRATARPLDAPAPAELRTMSSASVRGLPVLLALRGEAVLASTRIVLTGPGGGTFDLGERNGTPHAAVFVADVVDYCRLVARRVDPDAIATTREGDQTLLDALLRAAQSIAI